MIKVGEQLLVKVRVESIIESAKGISYRVCPLGEDRYYSGMDIIDKDIQSCIQQESEGGKKK